MSRYRSALGDAGGDVASTAPPAGAATADDDGRVAVAEVGRFRFVFDDDCGLF